MSEEQEYYCFDNKDVASKQKAFASYQPVDQILGKSQGGVGRTFKDFSGDNTVRSDYSRSDYEYFRPSEKLPKELRNLSVLSFP